MKLTALLKKIGEILNPFRTAMSEGRDQQLKKTANDNPGVDLRKGASQKDFLPEADVTTNIDRYRHPSEF